MTQVTPRFPASSAKGCVTGSHVLMRSVVMGFRDASSVWVPKVIRACCYRCSSFLLATAGQGNTLLGGHFDAITSVLPSHNTCACGVLSWAEGVAGCSRPEHMPDARHAGGIG